MISCYDRSVQKDHYPLQIAGEALIINYLNISIYVGISLYNTI